MISDRPPVARLSQRFKQYLKQFPILVFAKRSIWQLFHDPRFIIYALPLLALKPVIKSKLFRKMIFKLTKPNTLLISTGDSETFVISASDKVIGRKLYISNEPYDFDKMQKVLSILGNGRPEKLLIDVGANIGTICIPAIKRGAFQNAIAIEPEPRNYSLLLANIHINRLSDKIVAHNLALGSKDDEQLLFELSQNNFGDHRVHIRSNSDLWDEAHRKTIMVKSETLDKVIKHIDPKQTLIWMDTQGFEGHILFGAKNALRLRTPVCLEFWPYGMNRSKCYPHLKEALLQAGYNLFYDLNGSLSPIPITSKSLDGLYERLGDRGPSTEVLVV